MRPIYAQGDLLIEQLDDGYPFAAQTCSQAAIVLAEGEASGHRHVLYNQVTMFRDDALARDIPKGLYVAHVRVLGTSARLEHDEHATITLPKGLYRVRRQRELEPKDAQVVID